MSDLFIPKKIKVGYQKREGTYTGNLAYVIYFDNKGVLRKEKSWEGWRDKKIAAQEFNNEPQDGFCLNKDVKRFNWSHFGSNRSYIRMYDPRGIEFEVTPENLIGILTESDCLKRGLEGKFIYAWKGTELVLLPCASEEYNKAKVNTERQDQDIPAKDLKPGHSYTTKKGEEVIYLGRFPWYVCDRYGDKKARKATKQHIFVDPKSEPKGYNRFSKKSDVKFLASLNSNEPVSNYAKLIDEWNADIRSADIVRWEFSPNTDTIEDIIGTKADQKNYPFMKENEFVEQSGDSISFFSIGVQRYQDKETYYVQKDSTLDTKTMINTYNNRSYYDIERELSKEQLLKKISKSIKAKAILSNGKKVNVTSINDIVG